MNNNDPIVLPSGKGIVATDSNTGEGLPVDARQSVQYYKDIANLAAPYINCQVIVREDDPTDLQHPKGIYVITKLTELGNVDTSGIKTLKQTVNVTKQDIGLENVDNVKQVPQTRTINNKPLNSNVTLNASDVGAIDVNQKGANGGVAELDNTGKLKSAQIPTIVATTDSLNQKVDKVSNAAGNLPKINSSGNLENSGFSIPTTENSDQILGYDSTIPGKLKWINKPIDGQNGDSAYQTWLDINQHQSTDPGYSETDFINSLKAHIGKFQYENTDSDVVSNVTNIGDPVTSINNLIPGDGNNGTDNTLDVIVLMNNGDTTTPKTMMFSTSGDSTNGYKFYYVGDLQSAMPSNVLTETDIDDTHLVDPKSGALPTANDVLQLKVKLEGVTASEGKASYTPISGYLNTHVPEIESSPTAYYTEIPVVGVKSVRFLGIHFSTNNSIYYFGYGFRNANNELFNCTPYKNNADETKLEEYVVDVPKGALKLVCSVVLSSSLLNQSNFYCYLQSGDNVIETSTKIAQDVVDKEKGYINKDLGFEETKLTDYSVVSNYYIRSDGSAYGNGSSSGSGYTVNSYVEIDVSGFDYIRFNGPRFNTEYNMGFAFGHYIDNVWMLDSAMPFDNGLTSQEAIGEVTEYIKFIPQAATHVRISIYNSVFTGGIDIDNFYCYGRKLINKSMKFRKINLNLYETTFNIIGNQTQYNGKSVLIEVKENSIVRFKTGIIGEGYSYINNGMLYRRDRGFTLNEDASYSTLSGALPISLRPNTEYEIQVPNGCTNIYFPTSFSTYNHIQILEFYVEDEKEDAHVVNVSPVDKLDGYYYTDGVFNSQTTFKTYLFEVEDNTNYIANSFVGYSSLTKSPSITFYDANKQFIAYDARTVGVGHPVVLTNTRLIVPEGTKYIGITSNTRQFGLYKQVNKPTLDVINYVETDIEETIYGDIESNTESIPVVRKSAWGFRLPLNYNEDSNPIPVIAMLHGATGYVTPSVLGYGNSDGTATASYWKDWQDKYLNAGFAIFDINGYGIYSDNADTAVHSGNPMSIQTMKKAFEYLKSHYNISDKMFIHGTSMGGGLAQSYIKVYPEDVISIALFAPQCNAYSATITQGVGVPDLLAKNWGYEDEAAMIADGYSHFYNFNPLFNCLKIKKLDGSVAINKVSIEMMQDFIKDTDGIIGESVYQYLEKSIVPIKMWIGSADTTGPMYMEKAVYDAYHNGGTNIKLRIVDGATHNFCAGSSHTFVADEAIRFFKESL